MICIKNGNIHNGVREEAFVADILIENGDGCPFEVSTTVEQVYIDGVAIK